MNTITIVLFAAAAVVEAFALAIPKIGAQVSKEDESILLMQIPEQNADRWLRRLTILALMLTTAGGFASLWAPGFTE